jgi:hypothetical protein
VPGSSNDLRGERARDDQIALERCPLDAEAAAQLVKREKEFPLRVDGTSSAGKVDQLAEAIVLGLEEPGQVVEHLPVQCRNGWLNKRKSGEFADRRRRLNLIRRGEFI